MRRVCQECKRVFGFKEPMDDDSETTGICDGCFPIVMAKTKQGIRKLIIETEAILMDKKEGE